ncbi:hypothetical protein PEC302107_34000 [Pectobacterium araliae]|uniref:VENN motif-containing domain-containing protein n=1 Tax=Pectobacterium araliae TaxID=3073862 RepID=A0AAN0KMG6_9GAMM|nr:hypothetical protein PEC302110_21510 [Pectobacterium sp. MAFF 302110]GKW21671.1 hypothetical protein PEC302107_34000 [Pectobacterium carotovorum subsp. carotovorum]
MDIVRTEGELKAQKAAEAKGDGGDSGTGGWGHPESDCQRCIAISGTTGERDVTIPKDESKITASDIAANAMAHAVVGAVVAQLSGQDAAAGAMGASSGELIARAIMADQYPGKTANDLTEEEKQSVSALSTLASGLISGLAGKQHGVCCQRRTVRA